MASRSADTESSASQDRQGPRGDLGRLADLARHRYAQAANDFGSRTSNEALSAVA